MNDCGRSHALRDRSVPGRSLRRETISVVERFRIVKDRLDPSALASTQSRSVGSSGQADPSPIKRGPDRDVRSSPAMERESARATARRSRIQIASVVGTIPRRSLRRRPSAFPGSHGGSVGAGVRRFKVKHKMIGTPESPHKTEVPRGTPAVQIGPPRQTPEDPPGDAHRSRIQVVARTRDVHARRSVAYSVSRFRTGRQDAGGVRDLGPQGGDAAHAAVRRRGVKGRIGQPPDIADAAVSSRTVHQRRYERRR